MATGRRYKLDRKNPHYQEGLRMVAELELDHFLAEAKRSAEEAKRARSGGEPSQSSKRVCAGQGKPRGRRGGRRQASAKVTYPLAECPLPSHVEVLTVTSAKLSPQEEFEINMQRLSATLASCPPAEPPRSSASSWSFRQQRASERWREARPYHLKCLM
ncbi:hypothetical protein GJAV_G00140720, partial [Gymnothorax javanicus]